MNTIPRNFKEIPLRLTGWEVWKGNMTDCPDKYITDGHILLRTEKIKTKGRVDRLMKTENRRAYTLTSEQIEKLVTENVMDVDCVRVEMKEFFWDEWGNCPMLLENEEQDVRVWVDARKLRIIHDFTGFNQIWLGSRKPTPYLIFTNSHDTTPWLAILAGLNDKSERIASLKNDKGITP